jgi:ADP-ribose pyrophosphatase YjhB (NUDIX family)
VTKPFRFCPSCATELPERDEEGTIECPNCGRHWYHNPSPATGAVLVRDGRALLCKRAFEPETGKYDLPGGFLRVGEHPVDGLKREVAEELGLEIEVETSDLVLFGPHVYGDSDTWNLSLCFRARVVAGEPTPADDVSEVRWVTREELDDVELAWPHDRAAIEAVLGA